MPRTGHGVCIRWRADYRSLRGRSGVRLPVAAQGAHHGGGPPARHPASIARRIRKARRRRAMTTLQTTPASSPSELPGASPMTPVPARLISIEKETHDTYTLTLEPPAAQGAEFTSRFRPGQFSMLYDFGVGELP